MAVCALRSTLLILALAFPCGARAQDAPVPEAAEAPPPVDAQIAAIRETLTYARFIDAAAAVEALLARTDLTAAQRNAALEIRAIVLIARRRTPEARQALAELYGRDPDHRLGYREAGPSVRDEFERAQQQHAPRATVTLEDRMPDALERRQAPSLVVAVAEGGDTVHEIRVSYRNDPTDAFERTLMRLDPDGATAHARLPLREGGGAYTVQYYVEALAPSGFVLATLGAPEIPQTLAVPAEEIVASADPRMPELPEGDTPAPAGGGGVLEEGWFWAVVGVVLAGAAVGAGVGVWAGTQGPGAGSLGEGRL